MSDVAENLDTNSTQRHLRPVSLIFKAIFILMLAWFTYLLLTYSAYVTAGKTSWIFFALFITCCLFAIVTRKKYSIWRYTGLLSFALVTGYVSYSCIHYNGIDYEIIQVGKAVQEQCISEGHCPSEVPAFEQFRDMRYRRNRLHYYPNEELSSFEMFFHHGLEFGFLVKGGVNQELTYKSVYE